MSAPTLLHRDYATHEPVKISVKPDCIEILNYRRSDCSSLNPLLKRFLNELGFTHGEATGISTIQQELKRYGMRQASIETDENQSLFLITIPCHRDFMKP